MSARRPDVLERAFGVPPAGPALAAVIARRRRRDRTQRIVAALVAAAITIAGIAFMAHAFERAQQVPTGPITPQTVAGLKLAWWGETGSAIHATPVLADGRVFVTTQDGTVQAFDQSCSATDEPCPPVWTARLSSADVAGSHNPWGSPVVAGDRIYVGSPDGRLLGYPTDCVDTCQPTWVAQTSGSLAEGSIVAADGVVYAVSLSGTLYALPEACDTYPTPCEPLWQAQLSGGAIGGGPVAVGDTVYAATVTGHVYAFPTSCAQTGSPCAPRWDTETRGPIGTDLASDGRSVFVGVGRQVEAFPTDCSSTCSPSWIGPTNGPIAEAQPSSSSFVDDQVTSMSISRGDLVVGNGIGKVNVFPLACGTGGARCQPLVALRGDSFSDPQASGGVLFVGFSQGVRAYDLACLEASGSCQPLWTSVPGGAVTADSVEHEGSLFVIDEAGRVYRFSFDGTAQTPPPPADASAAHAHTTPSGVLPGAVALVLLIMGGSWLLGRRRRGSPEQDEPDDVLEWEDLGPAETD